MKRALKTLGLVIVPGALSLVACGGPSDEETTQTPAAAVIPDACAQAPAEATITGSGVATSQRTYRQGQASCPDAYVVDIKSYSPQTLAVVDLPPAARAGMTFVGATAGTAAECAKKQLSIAVWEQSTGNVLTMGTKALAKVDAPFRYGKDLKGRNVCAPPRALSLERWVPGFGAPGKNYKIAMRATEGLQTSTRPIAIEAFKLSAPKSPRAALQAQIDDLNRLIGITRDPISGEEREDPRVFVAVADGLSPLRDAVNLILRTRATETGALRRRTAELEKAVLNLALPHVVALGIDERVYRQSIAARIAMDVVEARKSNESPDQEFVSYVKGAVASLKATLALLDAATRAIPYKDGDDPIAAEANAARTLSETVRFAVSAMFETCDVPSGPLYDFLFSGVGDSQAALLGSCNKPGVPVDQIANGSQLGAAARSRDAAGLYRRCMADANTGEAKCKTDPRAAAKEPAEVPKEADRCTASGAQPGSTECEAKTKEATGNVVVLPDIVVTDEPEPATKVAFPSGVTVTCTTASTPELCAATINAASKAYRGDEAPTSPVQQQAEVAHAQGVQDGQAALPTLTPEAVADAQSAGEVLTDGLALLSAFTGLEALGGVSAVFLGHPHLALDFSRLSAA